MRKSWKKLALLMAAVLSLSLAGCSSKPAEAAPAAPAESKAAAEAAPEQAEKKVWKIGFSNSFSGNTWRAVMLASLQQEIDKRDDVEVIIVDGQNDINKQVNDIENLIAQGVDAIMCIPGSAQAVEPVLKEARQNGIKVAIFNMPLTDKEAYDIYIGTDMTDKSAKMTRWLCDKIGGKGNIVMLGGPSGNSGTAIFRQEAERILAEEYPDVKVLQYRDADWKEDKAKQVMTDLLLAYPGQIDGVWTDSGQNEAGAIKAMVANGKEMMPICGNSAYNSIFGMYVQNVEKFPNFDFCLTPEPTNQSKICLQQVVKLLNGEQMEQDQIIDVPVYTGAENADMYNPDLPDNMFVDHDLTPENLQKILNSK